MAKTLLMNDNAPKEYIEAAIEFGEGKDGPGISIPGLALDSVRFAYSACEHKRWSAPDSASKNRNMADAMPYDALLAQSFTRMQGQ